MTSIEFKYGSAIGDAALRKFAVIPVEIWDELNTDQTVQLLAELLKTRIKARTAMGVDYRGAAFKPYSPSYRRQKEKRGRYSGVVNLFDTGKMLGSIDDNNSGDFKSHGVNKTGILDFRTQTSNNKAFYNNKLREFFNYNDKDRNAIIKELELITNRIIDGYNK